MIRSTSEQPEASGKSSRSRPGTISILLKPSRSAYAGGGHSHDRNWVGSSPSGTRTSRARDIPCVASHATRRSAAVRASTSGARPSWMEGLKLFVIVGALSSGCFFDPNQPAAINATMIDATAAIDAVAMALRWPLVPPVDGSVFSAIVEVLSKRRLGRLHARRCWRCTYSHSACGLMLVLVAVSLSAAGVSWSASFFLLPSELEPDPGGGVVVEQLGIPDVAADHAGRAVAGLLHDGAFALAGLGCRREPGAQGMPRERCGVEAGL
jgi:hypothetical protein